MYTQVCTYFPKILSQLKILGVIRVAGSQFCAEDPLILGATVTSVAATATGCPGSTHLCTEEIESIAQLNKTGKVRIT
jgi:hypothetical protein